VSGDGASPLGRYTPEHDDTPELHTVHLLSVPLRVLLSGREHHDGVMREFRLPALTGTPARDVPVRMLELTEVLGRQYAAAEPGRTGRWRRLEALMSWPTSSAPTSN
jgi:hypothetical protein